jgi:hypothetical protein
LRLESTRSYTCSMYSAGTNASTLVTEEKPATAQKARR